MSIRDNTKDVLNSTENNKNGGMPTNFMSSTSVNQLGDCEGDNLLCF